MQTGGTTDRPKLIDVDESSDSDGGAVSVDEEFCSLKLIFIMGEWEDSNEDKRISIAPFDALGHYAVEWTTTT